MLKTSFRGIHAEIPAILTLGIENIAIYESSPTTKFELIVKLFYC